MMNIVNCHYCGLITKDWDLSNSVGICPPCALNHGLDYVFTCLHDDGTLTFAHIMIGEYHIRYRTDSNVTEFIIQSTNKIELTLDGEMITPENAKKKLKMYLLLM